MTKPTITQSNIRYAIFRKDSLEKTNDYALRNKIYYNLFEANEALGKLRSELPLPLKNLVEVRTLDSYKDDEDFGKNLLAYYD